MNAMLARYLPFGESCEPDGIRLERTTLVAPSPSFLQRRTCLRAETREGLAT